MVNLTKKISLLMLLTVLSGTYAGASDDILSNEELEQKLVKMREQNNELELEHQRELERQKELKKREELLRQINEEEKRQQQLQQPFQQLVQENTEKKLADAIGDFATNGLKSLFNKDQKDEQGTSNFVKSREALKNSFKGWF